MGQWIDTWYPTTIDAYKVQRGNAAGSLPAIRPLDGIAVLGQLSPSIVTAIRLWLGQMGLTDNNVVYAYTGQSVEGGIAPITDEGTALASTTSVDAWLAGTSPWVGYSWIRTGGTLPNATGNAVVDRVTAESVQLYEPTFVNRALTVTEPAIVAAWHELVNSWDRAVTAVSAGILYAGTTFATSAMDATNNASLWREVRIMCAQLEVLNENPPATDKERITAAASDALNKSATVIGQGAAMLASKVGETAMKAAEGFLDSATVMTMIVGGIAVYAFVH